MPRLETSSQQGLERLPVGCVVVLDRGITVARVHRRPQHRQRCCRRSAPQTSREMPGTGSVGIGQRGLIARSELRLTHIRRPVLPQSEEPSAKLPRATPAAMEKELRSMLERCCPA